MIAELCLPVASGAVLLRIDAGLPAPACSPPPPSGMICRTMATRPRPPFNSIYAHGFARASVCVPQVKVASPAFNADRTIALAREAAADHSVLALFPELGISAYSNEDLFQQDALLDATEEALG